MVLKRVGASFKYTNQVEISNGGSVEASASGGVPLPVLGQREDISLYADGNEVGVGSSPPATTTEDTISELSLTAEIVDTRTDSGDNTTKLTPRVRYTNGNVYSGDILRNIDGVGKTTTLSATSLDNITDFRLFEYFVEVREHTAFRDELLVEYTITIQ